MPRGSRPCDVNTHNSVSIRHSEPARIRSPFAIAGTWAARIAAPVVVLALAVTGFTAPAYADDAPAADQAAATAPADQAAPTPPTGSGPGRSRSGVRHRLLIRLPQPDPAPAPAPDPAPAPAPAPPRRRLPIRRRHRRRPEAALRARRRARRHPRRRRSSRARRTDRGDRPPRRPRRRSSLPPRASPSSSRSRTPTVPLIDRNPRRLGVHRRELRARPSSAVADHRRHDRLRDVRSHDSGRRTTVPITVTETQQAGYELVQQDGKNFNCAYANSGVTNSGPLGVTFAASGAPSAASSSTSSRRRPPGRSRSRATRSRARRWFPDS